MVVTGGLKETVLTALLSLNLKDGDFRKNTSGCFHSTGVTILGMTMELTPPQVVAYAPLATMVL